VIVKLPPRLLLAMQLLAIRVLVNHRALSPRSVLQRTDIGQGDGSRANPTTGIDIDPVIIEGGWVGVWGAGCSGSRRRQGVEVMSLYHRGQSPGCRCHQRPRWVGTQGDVAAAPCTAGNIVRISLLSESRPQQCDLNRTARNRSAQRSLRSCR